MNKPSRTERKQTAILQAAKTIFLQQGYEQTSMDSIAIVAQVSKRTIYDHFKTKKALFAAMLKYHWKNIAMGEVEHLENLDDTSQYLKHFAKTFLKFVYQPDTIALFRLLTAESPQFHDVISHLVIEGKAPFTRTLITFLQKKSRKVN